MRRIAIINQKGGVGKTTTAVNLGSALARAGQQTVLIDLDPQAHLTTHLGLEPNLHRPGTYELLMQSLPIERLAQPVRERLEVVSSHIDLAAAELELVSVVGREVILRDLLARYCRPCDFILMDCPPSLGVLTLNGLAAANEVFIPLQPHFLALQGMGKLLETVQLVAQRINPTVVVSGIVLCMYESGTRLAEEVVEDLKSFLNAARCQQVPWRNAQIFRTRIRRNIKLAECPSHGRSIFDYAPRSHGALDYAALAEEVLAMAQPPGDAGPGDSPPAMLAQTELAEPSSRRSP
ncbi:MAG: ParA family protein [Phycisphaerae bacterium]